MQLSDGAEVSGRCGCCLRDCHPARSPGARAPEPTRLAPRQAINGERRWSEFDGNRGHDEQRRNIEKGREILGVKANFLSPLYNSAGRALGRISLLGKNVSYHGSRTPGAGLAEVSACIDVHEDLDASGNKIEKSLDDLWREFQSCRARMPFVGVMLHHAKCEGQRVETLRAFVQKLKAEPGVEFRTINEIAERSGG